MAMLKTRAPAAPKAATPAKAPKAQAPTPEPKTAVPVKANGTGKAAVGIGVGVIATIIALLRNGGGTVEELTKKLAERFPDRDARGMSVTTRIQVKRLPKEGKLNVVSEDVPGRGTVFRAAD